MFTNNHHQKCGFEGLLVSYIYDEIGASEKSKFEKHLDDCKICVEEFSSLGFVRSSINDWKDMEFSQLQTPSIRIPEIEPKRDVEFIKPTRTTTRFALIRDLFSLKPTWATATSIAAALTIIVGIVFVIVNISNSPEVTETRKSISPTAPKFEEKDQLFDLPDENGQSADEKVIQPAPEMVRETLPKTVDNDKASEKREKVVVANRPKKNETDNKLSNKPGEGAFANKNDRLATQQKPGEIPKLTNFDVDEDDSLRLADLFDEVGSK